MRPFISDAVIRSFQKKYYDLVGGKPNVSVPLAPSELKTREDGISVLNEVQYSKSYPNGFADIFYAADAFAEKKPTIVYLHGGGWFMGSRTNGDPLAEGTAGAVAGIAKQNIMLAKNGYNVVSMDYCLSPDYRYPSQLIQIDEGLGFFKENAQKYHLDMERIILMGGSAGAVMCAILGAVYSNAEYSKLLGVSPHIELESIRGLCIDGAPMNTKLLNWGTLTMFRSWIGKHGKNCAQAKQIHVCEWINEKYPKTFLTAGNDGCFPEHTQELGTALRDKGVEVDEFYIDPNESKQGHGYLNNWETDPYAKEGMSKQLAFIKRVAV